MNWLLPGSGGILPASLRTATYPGLKREAGRSTPELNIVKRERVMRT